MEQMRDFFFPLDLQYGPSREKLLDSLGLLLTIVQCEHSALGKPEQFVEVSDTCTGDKINPIKYNR